MWGNPGEAIVKGTLLQRRAWARRGSKGENKSP